LRINVTYGAGEALSGFAAAANDVVRDAGGLQASGLNDLREGAAREDETPAVSIGDDGLGALPFGFIPDAVASDTLNGAQDWPSAISSGGQGSARAADAEAPNGVAAAPAHSSDTSNAPINPVDSSEDSSLASIADDSTEWDGAIAAQVQPGSFGYQVAHTGLAPLTPVDDGGNAAPAGWFAPAASAPAPAVLASLAPMSFGTPLAEAGLVNPGSAAEAADGHQGAHAVQEPAAPADSGAALASLDNPPAGSSGAAITSSGIGADGATAAQVQQALDDSGLSVNGSGIKVGVLSDSFNDLGGAAADEADGALPPAADIDVIKDLASGGTDEGRAMMQIIHDIAPGASLAFYTAFDSEQDFANGILALAAAGCKVIVDDVAYYDEPFFQNGVVAQAIQTVEAEGVTYVTAAGNEASNGYQAAWTPISGSFDGTYLTDAESFGGSVVQTVAINTEGTGDEVPLILEWNQPYGATTSDLEIFVFHNGILYGEFSNRNAGQELNNPLVDVQLPSGTYQIAIENLSGPNPGLIKEITEGDGFPATISGANTGTVVGHAMTPGAITAGAVSAADTPAFGVSTPLSESFSSSGAGAELLFADNGTALSSPDDLSPVVVSGVDDISTTVSGNLSDFYGTSAASASLAGVAALILSAEPTLTPAQVEQIMEQTALPMANSAVSGAGLVQVDPAVADAEALVTTVIQTDGTTSLVEVGDDYYLYGTSTETGPSLKYGGADIVAGAAGGWAPIGAVQTATGYDIAWKEAGASEYSIWSTDSNGNFIAYLTGAVSGSSTTLESYETIFGQDLNGDGVIGIPATTVIQTDVSTSLVQTSKDYYLNSVGSGTGPELQYGGAPVVAGASGAWSPIGAVQTATGYDVAWEEAGANEFSIWSTDSNGNFLAFLTGAVSGSSTTLESYEPIFDQNLNGDGRLTATVIQTDTGLFGSTSLTEVGDQVLSVYYLDSSGGSGPALKYGGADIVAAPAAWAPVGAVQTATGYDIAWKETGANEYSIWSTDGNGNFLSYLTGAVLGTSTTLESYETIFNQDLNGDGTIGASAAASAFDRHSPHNSSAQAAVTTGSETEAAPAGAVVSLGGPGNDSFIFHPGAAAGVATNAGSADPMQFERVWSGAGNQQRAFSHDAPTGPAQAHFETTHDGHDTSVDPGHHGSAAAMDFQFTDPHVSHFIIS
jgi:hypothetical protein